MKTFNMIKYSGLVLVFSIEKKSLSKSKSASSVGGVKNSAKLSMI